MKNVSKKLLNVISALDGTITKSGYNSHNKYHYVMEKDLLEAVRPELIKQGLLVTMSIEEVSRSGDLTTVRTKHTIIDTESGETIEIFGAGEGSDKQDKGCPKAITSASKYFWFKTALLSGGDDPENDGLDKASKTNVKGAPGVPSSGNSKPNPSAAKSTGAAFTAPKTSNPVAEATVEVKTPSFQIPGKPSPTQVEKKSEKVSKPIFSVPKPKTAPEQATALGDTDF